MKILTTLCAIILMSSTMLAQKASSTSSQSKSLYNQSMGQLLSAFSQAKSIEDYNKVANDFKRVAQAEQDKWLPLYYATQCKILMSFMSKDADTKDAYLDEIEANFDTMVALDDKSSEIPALKSLFYSARLVVNPMVRGQEYMMLSNKECEKALALNPQNNRAKYMLIKNFMGFAQFFGSDTNEQCSQASELLNQWDANETSDRLMPHWGKYGLEKVVKSCDKATPSK